MKVSLIIAFLFLAWMPANAIKSSKNNKTGIVKVMSFNVRHCTNKDGKLNITRTAKAITDSGADIVLLQEVDNKTGRSDGKDQAYELGKQTGMANVFGKAIDFSGGGYGVAVLSKYPILETNNTLLPHNPETEPRTALWVTVKVGQDTISFVNTHLQSGTKDVDYKTRMQQVGQLKKDILNHPYPVVLGGDLNSHPDFPAYLYLAEFMKTSDKEPYSPTYPGIDPYVKIDYILTYKPECFKVLDYRVIDDELVSDHRPIMATLKLSNK
ncbi:endonuclease/exonuclease/phosphatase family protein [Prolixibacteraceae bacterium Z1-6]|uniref:Endonuclease/exonuclease/phosphatase family protein n=1 Tax=Draconibacterium aestuarii TaxID=2998507 RepID=A0A9X3F2I8_9BACT|nr:endonuclease/exonuclease/phosphatase family protein [Prolixibacteraceae bacterium Z1-6]